MYLEQPSFGAEGVDGPVVLAAGQEHLDGVVSFSVFFRQFSFLLER